MQRYEVLMLMVPELTADESSMLESQVEQMIKDHKSTLISFERWGKYRLAYPVRNHDYGIYYLVRMECAPEQKAGLLDAVATFCMVKHTELVMRYMTHVLPSQGSLEYARPESLEDAPTREPFMKEARASSESATVQQDMQ
jgi:small subunit ribosomal protein S6